MKSVALKTRLARKTYMKKKQMGDVSKQGRKSVKSFKGEPSVYKDPAFDDLDDIVDDAMDYMESEDAQDEGRTSSVVVEEKEGAYKKVSTEAPISTVKPNEGTDKQDGGTDSIKVSTDRQGEEGKGKGVKIRNAEDTKRPRPTSTRSILTLRPLPKIDLNDKGKKRIEEEDEFDTESEDITEAEKKFKQLANDEEVAKKVQEEWEAEEDKKRLDEDEATKVALFNEYDFIQARLNADKVYLAEKLQRRFLAQQRSEAIRNKPPSRNQLRKMMTYLKHVGGKKHSDPKTKSFNEIKALYDKIKRSEDSFIAIGSAEDEKVIKEMNEQVVDASKKRVKKDDSIKGEIKEKERTRKRKLVSDEDKEVDYEILDKKYPIIEWRSEYLTTKPQYDETEEIEDVYLNVVIRSNRRRRYFSTLMAVLSILDRDDICAIYQLQNWKIVSWKLHSSSGVHTVMTDEGLVIHIFVENKYPLKKEVLSQLIELKLETEEDSTMALELIRFVKK
ncbi:hypothetical protein Tco_0980458 [Tanacetum coccineum]